MDELDFDATIRGFIAGQKLFGRYTLIRQLGRGGMGVVWRARDESLERDVAIKMLTEMVANDPAAVRELKRETSRNQQLSHPHILRVYDFAEGAGLCGITMEIAEGGTLTSRRLDQPGEHFEPHQVREWLGQLCEALDYAHQRGKVVHRDLKPANLMLSADGELKITDFGIAASLSESVTRVSKQAGTSGTPVYMSPQQMMGEKPAVTDDIYALGATLYELLTGKPPFYAGNILLQVQSKVPPKLAERRAEFRATAGPVPPEWESTIAACLAKEAKDRPQTAGAVAERLGLAIAGKAQPSPSNAERSTQEARSGPKSPQGVPVHSGPAHRRGSTLARRTSLQVGLAAAVLLSGGLGYYFGIHAPEQRRLAAIARLEAEGRAAEAVKLKNEQERAAGEKRLAEEARRAQEAAAKAGKERVERLSTQLRSRLAELNVVHDAAMRAEQNAERKLSDLKSQARDLARLGNGEATPAARRAAAFVAAQERLVGWMRDSLPAHPATIARARAEGLLSGGAVDEALAACDAYASALAGLKSDLAAARDAAVITGSVEFTANQEGVLWRLRDAWGEEREGTTPATLSDVPLGTGEVVFRFSTFPAQEKPVQVERRTTTVSAEFVPARLTIQAEPAEATVVFRDGPQANGSTFTLAPGLHAFRVEAPGYASRELRLTVGPAAVESRRIVLGRRPVDHLLADFLQRLQSASDSTLAEARSVHPDLAVAMLEVFTAAGDPLGFEVARLAIDPRIAIFYPPVWGHQTTLETVLAARPKVAELPRAQARAASLRELVSLIEACADRGDLTRAFEIWQAHAPQLPGYIRDSYARGTLKGTFATALEAARRRGDEAGHLLWAREAERLASRAPPAYLADSGGRDDWVLLWLDVLRQAGLGGKFDDLARQLQAASRSRKVTWAGNHNSDWGQWTRNRKWPQTAVEAKHRPLFERAVDKTGSFHDGDAERAICLFRAKSLAAIGQTEAAFEATLHSHSETGATVQFLAPTFARLADWDSTIEAIGRSRRLPYDYMQNAWDIDLRQAHEREDQRLRLKLALVYGAAVAERVEPAAAREALAKTADPALQLLAMTGYLARYFELASVSPKQRDFIRSTPVL